MHELDTAREYMHFFLAFAEQHANAIRDERRPFSVETWEEAYRIWEQRQDHHVPESC